MGLLRVMMPPKLQLLALLAFAVAMFFLENQIQKLEESRGKLGKFTGPSEPLIPSCQGPLQACVWEWGPCIDVGITIVLHLGQSELPVHMLHMVQTKVHSKDVFSYLGAVLLNFAWLWGKNIERIWVCAVKAVHANWVNLSSHFMQSSVRQKTGALFVPDLMHNGVYTVLFSLEVNLTGILCAYDLAFPLLELMQVMKIDLQSFQKSR